MEVNDLASAAALFKNPVPTHGPKRNTACHQCRKRKLKCDTKRPCSTCVRSHAYAQAHASEEADLPDEPECTYGELPKETVPQSKVEKLENRIGELEDLLRQMQLALDSSQNGNTSNFASTSSPSPAVPSSSSGVMPSSGPQFFDPSGSMNSTTSPVGQSAFTPSAPYENYMIQPNPSTTFFDNMDFSQFAQMDGSNMLDSFSAGHSTSAEGALIPFNPINDRKTELLLMGWPMHLPEPEVTRHLVHAFFAFNMHAGRLFHGPTFLASLDLNPNDPRFPYSALLHAMCAVGSLYTADIPQPPMQRRTRYATNGQFFAVDELFPGRWRQLEQRPDSFAEQHAKYAKLAGEAALDRGEHLLECLQTQIILTWFYLCQARWSESYLSSGQALRCTVPCGINISPPFHGSGPSLMFRPEKPPSILSEAQSVIDHETRRNIFWIAYALERQQAAGNSFAMVLDDMDICQLLPLRGDQYERGLSVPVDDRQWSHDRKMLLNHPHNQIDSFILYIKSTILMSHVKNFNLRFRGRYFAGDASMYSPSSSPTSEPDRFDPRDTQAFQELDHYVTSFKGSFPAHMRNPVQDEMVDSYLYTAHCAAHLAQILLHEPHVRMSSSHDLSVGRVMKAARGILDLMYAISATSFDVSLLDHLPILCWNVCGRVLTKGLKAAVDKKDYEQSLVLQAEIAFVHSMLAKAGERMPLAYRYKQMVYEILLNTCGREYVQSLPENSYHRGGFTPPPSNASYDQTTYSAPVFAPAAYAMSTMQDGDGMARFL